MAGWVSGRFHSFRIWPDQSFDRLRTRSFAPEVRSPRSARKMMRAKENWRDGLHDLLGTGRRGGADGFAGVQSGGRGSELRLHEVVLGF